MSVEMLVFLAFFLLAYALICGGWVYGGVICVGHVLAVLGPWEGDLEGGKYMNEVLVIA